MKKIKYFLLVMLFMFIGLNNVNALSLNTDKNDVKPKDSFKVNITNAKTGSNAYRVIYDDAIIMKTNFSGVDCSTYCTISSGSGSITFYVKEKDYTENKNVSITFVDSNGAEEKVSVNLVANKPTTKAPEPSTTTTTAATTTASNKSNNANLKSLEINKSDGTKLTLDPVFKPDVTNYSATVESSVKKVEFVSIPEDSKAIITYNPEATKELKDGEINNIIITVTAEDGTTKKTYTVKIKREALTTDATLKELVIKEAPNFKLIDGKFDYNIRIDNKIKKLTISCVTNDSNSTYKIEGNENLKNGSIVKIKVTAPDETVKEYKINIIKRDLTTNVATKKKVGTSEKNPLIIMLLSIIAFGLIGGIVYVVKNK